MRYLTLALLLAGCGAATPEGQVAARVDGIEITDREIVSEATAGGADLSRPADRAAIIDRLIDRTLLARAGEAALVDRTPATQIEGRRVRRDVLARAYAQRIAAALPMPSDLELDRFMQDRPHAFAGRSTYLFDQLRFAAGTDAAAIAARPIDQAARALAKSNSAFSRRLVLIDSGDLSEAADASLAALAPGAARRSQAGGRVTINVLIERRPIVEDAGSRRARARDMLIRLRAGEAAAAAVKALRTKADIAIRAPDAGAPR